jgi:hypothetical protein
LSPRKLTAETLIIDHTYSRWSLLSEIQDDEGRVLPKLPEGSEIGELLGAGIYHYPRVPRVAERYRV